jgi:hypothetical protein
MRILKVLFTNEESLSRSAVVAISLGNHMKFRATLDSGKVKGKVVPVLN